MTGTAPLNVAADQLRHDGSPASGSRHGGGLVTRSAVLLVYAAALYPLAICFINTRVAPMPNAAIIIAETLIGLATIPLLVARPSLGTVIMCLALCLNFFLLAVLQQDIDLKALRDLLMPVVFIWLGYIVADRRTSERVLRNLAIIAVALGLVEFIFPAFFSSLFDTIAFYTERGFGASNRFQMTVLQTRPTGIGRSILPFLGPRRISSLFLEPVSLGNFAVLTAAWALAKPRQEMRSAVWLVLLAAAMIVMADARFGLITILLLIGVRATNIWKARMATALMPLVAMAMLILITLLGPGEIHDDITGRFQVSGGNLLSLPWDAWLGIPAVISMDAGYGYIIQRTGLTICCLLWFVFATLPLRDDQARRFHFNIAVYACLNLCISGSSLFSLKTTAVLWLLLGTVVAHRATVDRFGVSPVFGQPPRPAWISR